MSYITLPKSLIQIKSNSKPLDAYVWATIRSCSNYRDGESHVRIERLVKLTNIKERTIRRSIRRLKESELLKITTHFSDETTRHNTYYTDFRMRNFFMLDREFFQQGYDPKIAGFLLLLKCVCINGTNTIGWNKREIADGIGMARNTVSALLEECLRRGLITQDEWGYRLTGDFFINDTLRSMDKEVFETLRIFCEQHGSRLRDYKSQSRVALELIGARYRPLADYRENPYVDLRHNLERRCPQQLPPEVSIEYFLKPLKLQTLYDQYLRGKQNRPKTPKAYAM